MCSSNFYSFPYNCLIDNLTNELCGYTFICGKSGKHQTLTILSKENSNNFLIKGVIITAEYSPGFLNKKIFSQDSKESKRKTQNEKKIPYFKIFGNKRVCQTQTCFALESLIKQHLTCFGKQTLTSKREMPFQYPIIIIFVLTSVFHANMSRTVSYERLPSISFF